MGAVVKAGAVRRRETAVLTGPGAAPPASPGTPKGDVPEVRLTRDGDLLESIEVHCPCGRHVVLECLYDPNMDPGPR